MKKKLKFTFILATILLISSACTQDENIDSTNGRSSKNFPENPVANYYVNDENALVFNSTDAYYELTDSLLKLTQEEFSIWEKKNHFKSYRTITQEILVKATECEDEKALASMYTDYVKITPDGFIEPIIQAQSYSIVLNKDLCFYIGNKKHRVDENYVMTTGSETNEKKYRYTDLVSTKSQEYGNTLEYPTISSVPADKRKVFTWFRIYRNIVTAPNGSVFHAVDLDITVRPRKLVNHVFGSSWKDYNTICHIDELKIRMPGIGGNTFTDENGQFIYKEDEYWSLKTISSSKECSRFTNTFRLKTSNSEITGALSDLICIHYRARTRGTDRNGAAYNVFHPLPGMTNCGHREVTPYQHTQY